MNVFTGGIEDCHRKHRAVLKGTGFVFAIVRSAARKDQGDSSMKRYAWCLALILPSATAFAGPPESFDWPQWQGPDRNAVSKERGLLKRWKEDGPPLAWKIKGLGGGYSAPSVAAGRIFGMSNRGDDEVIWALSETDGKELWVKRLGPAFPQRRPQGKEGPGCTPTVDGELL